MFEFHRTSRRNGRAAFATWFGRISGISGLPKIVWLMTAGAFLKFAVYFAYPFAGLYLRQFLGATITEIGWVFALFSFGMLAGYPLFGLFIDRLGSRAILVACSVIEGLGWLLLPLVHSLWAFAFIFMFIGFLTAGFRPAYQGVIMHSCHDGDRPRALALFMMAWNSSMGIVVAIGGILFAYSPTLMFALDAALNLFAGAFFAVVLSARPAHPIANVGAAAGALSGATSATARQAPRPWRDVGFLVLCAAIFLLEAVRSQSTSTFPIYVKDVYRLTAPQFGSVMAIGSFVLVFFSLPVTAFVKSIDRRLLVGVGGGILCGAFALCPWGNGLTVALLVISIAAIGQMLALPTLTTLVMARATPRTRGQYLGIYYGAASAAWCIAPVLGSQIYGMSGPNLLWSACGVVGCLVAALMLGWYRISRTSSTATVATSSGLDKSAANPS
jgi:MFS family permease